MISFSQAHNLANHISSNYQAALDINSPKPYVIAIDGPCASGKSVLARNLKGFIENKHNLSVGLIELDHFFLPPDLRSSKRLDEPGGNIHYERFLDEVIHSIQIGKQISYRRFSCKTMTYTEELSFIDKDIILLEGAYSHHPLWYNTINLTIFCEADLQVRLQRIELRDGPVKLEQFISKWIPMENMYFEHYDIRAKSDIIFQS